MRPQCCAASTGTAMDPSAGLNGEILRGDDPRAFVTVEGEQAALVAGHEIIRLARFRQGEQKIVRGIGRALHVRQRIDVLGELLDLVDQATGLLRFDEFGHTWLLQRGAQFVDMRHAGQERKFSMRR